MQSDKPLPRHKPGDRIESKRMNAFEEKAITDITVGPGLSMVRRGNAVTIGKVKDPRTPPGTLVTVRVEEARTGDAWYGGFLWDKPTEAADTTDDADEATAGTEGDEVSILNLQEAGGGSASGHDLTDADNTDQRLFLGRLVGQVDEEGRQVVHINGVWGGCE